MMKTLKIISQRQSVFSKEKILEKLPLLYSKYEIALKVIDAILENDYTKRIKLRISLKNGEIEKKEYDILLHEINHRIRKVDYKRYLCFTTYIARYFDGDEDELVSLMNANDYHLLSKRYIQTPVKMICADILDFIFE